MDNTHSCCVDEGGALPSKPLHESIDAEKSCPEESALRRAPSDTRYNAQMSTMGSITTVKRPESLKVLTTTSAEPIPKRIKVEGLSSNDTQSLLNGTNQALQAQVVKRSSPSQTSVTNLKQSANTTVPFPLTNSNNNSTAGTATAAHRLGIEPEKVVPENNTINNDIGGSKEEIVENMSTSQIPTQPLSKQETTTATLAAPSTTTVPTGTATATTAAPTEVETPVSESKPPTAETAMPDDYPNEKATLMSQLRTKYMSELDYMLCEFQKLERQLLGAKSAANESAGSKERREKLHSFIQHLQDTITQIENGCKVEEASAIIDNSLVVNATASETESVAKLEEHIQANLLPVKVRLKKQLAAQQGAKHNPAGMPHSRQGYTTQSPPLGKGTFAAAAESRRREAEASRLYLVERQPAANPVDPEETQFNKPITNGGSILTKKLHGPTLGSTERIHGHGVGRITNPEQLQDTIDKPKVIFAGMAIGSNQFETSVTAASNAHLLVIKDPSILNLSRPANSEGIEGPLAPTNDTEIVTEMSAQIPKADAPIKTENDKSSVEERRRLRRLQLKKKLKMSREAKLHLLSLKGPEPVKSSRKKQSKQIAKKRGPRAVEYMCAVCNEIYSSTCDYNPWWALAQHECPKCKKMQIPRVDISAPANAIEYHPALLAHAEEPVSPPASTAPTPVKSIDTAPTIMIEPNGTEEDSIGSDLSDDYLDDDFSDSEIHYSDESEMEGFDIMSPMEQAEHERFGASYKGPKLSEETASRLLVMMLHASKCPCRHKSAKHRDVCRSTKWMMLHVRDCPGTTSSFDVCPYPWCRKLKHFLYHLVSCTNPTTCAICSPTNLSTNFVALMRANESAIKSYDIAANSTTASSKAIAKDTAKCTTIESCQPQTVCNGTKNPQKNVASGQNNMKLNKPATNGTTESFPMAVKSGHSIINGAKKETHVANSK